MPPDIATTGYPQGPKWTVMVFMGAATIEGDAPMIDAANADLAEMRSVGSGPVDSGGELNIFVQVHRGKGVVPRRGQVFEGMADGIDALETVPERLRDPAGGLALLSFIRWALEKADHKLNDPYHPDHYSLLVLWGHAYDFAMDREQTRKGTIDALDFAELAGVLKQLQQEFGSPDAKLDIVGFDACDLATVEMACQLEPFAKYLLGSQIGIPIPGWPYDRILDRLRKPIGRVMGPAELGSYIVRRFCESYTTASRSVSLTLLDLKRAQELFSVAGGLALALANGIGDPNTREQLASFFLQSQTAAGKPYVDVADLCLNLIRSSRDPLIINAARAVGNFLISPGSEVVGKSQEGGGRPFVVEHGRNAGQTARLNGISIYAPQVAPTRDFDAVQRLYNKFVFAQKTDWNGLVHALARLS